MEQGIDEAKVGRDASIINPNAHPKPWLWFLVVVVVLLMVVDVIVVL